MLAASQTTSDDCIVVTGFTGRPKATYRGRQMWCARIVWIMAEGNPGRAHVLHTCHRGDEGCVNRRHLYLGDTRRNMADRDEAGRQARGSHQGHAILTEEQIGIIRAEHVKGARYPRPESTRALAERFGVARETIKSVIQRRNWKHLN
ncbi:hypothetical protein AB0N20_22665 [Streptomyces griseoincarnatus]